MFLWIEASTRIDRVCTNNDTVLKLDIPGPGLVSNSYLQTQQEQLTLFELRRLKPLSLGSQESPSGQPEMRWWSLEGVSVVLMQRPPSGQTQFQWMTILGLLPTLQLFTNCSILSLAWLKYALYWRSKYSQDPLVKVFSKYKLDKLPAFFCHPNAHSCRCIFIKHRLISHSFREMLGTYQREWRHRTRKNGKINYLKVSCYSLTKRFTKSSMPMPNYFTSCSIF